MPTPNFPVLTFKLIEIQSSEFPVKLAKERTMQFYRPSFMTWSAGFSVSMLLFALGSGNIADVSSGYAGLYTMSGAALFTGTVLQLKPSGKPVYTGERSVLKQVGTTVLVDSVPSKSVGEIPARYEMSHPSFGTVAVNAFWNKGSLSINLPVAANWTVLTGDDPGILRVTLETGDARDTLSIPLQSFMRGFVEINRPKTILYIKPVVLPSASLTELGPPSRVPFVRKENEQWTEVRYGITPCFVETRKVKKLWILSPDQVEQKIVAEAIPFGRIDVERDIPTRWRKKTESAALILSRPAKYQSERKLYQERDAKLMNAFMIDYFGLDPAFIAESTDSTKTLTDSFSKLRPTISEGRTGTLFVYLNAKLSAKEGTLQLVNAHRAESEPMTSFLDSLRSLPFKSLVFIAEAGYDETSTAEDLNVIQSFWNSQLDLFTAAGKKAAFFMAASPGERTYSYRDPRLNLDKQHGLFTYIFCNGLRLGYHDYSLMKRYLETDVLYFSRKFRDRAQRPFVIGTLNSILPE